MFRRVPGALKNKVRPDCFHRRTAGFLLLHAAVPEAPLSCRRPKKPVFQLTLILCTLALSAFGIVGVVYFLVRIIGKYIGAYLGCLAVKSEKTVRNYLGIALIPQAGVAIGLAYLAERILPEDIGNLLMTIVLASSVLYELIGPVSAKFALIRSGAIRKRTDKEEKTVVCPAPHVPEIPEVSVTDTTEKEEDKTAVTRQ